MKQFFYFLMSVFCLQVQGQQYPIELEYDNVYEFRGGLAAVRLNGKWGFIDKKGKEIVPCKYDNLPFFSEGLAHVELKGKYGLINKAGKEIIPCIYDNPIHFSEGLAGVKLNGKGGFIDKNGKEIIPFRYDEAYYFSEGLGSVKLKGKEGFIDKNGKEIIPCEYFWVRGFSGGLAWVTRNALHWGLIDKNGNEIVPCKYENVREFSERLTWVTLNYKWGLVDNNGNEVVPCKYEELYWPTVSNLNFMEEELAAGVKLNGKWGLIGKNGKEIAPCKYDRLSSFPTEALVEVELNGKWGLIDKNGKEVTPCKYEVLGFFSDGLAVAKLNGKLGGIDITGKEVAPCKYDDLKSFSEGLIKVKIEGKWGLIDKMGKDVLPCKYDVLEPFSEGLVRVILEGKQIFIDKTGKEVLPFEYDNLRWFSDGLVEVRLNGKWGYIDKTGKVMIPCAFDATSCFSEGIATVKKDGKWYLIQNPLLTPQTTVQALFFRSPDPNIHQTTEQPYQELKVGYVANMQLQASDFSLYVNGERQESKAGTVPLVSGSTVTLTAKLSAGKNTIEVKAGGKTTEQPLVVTYNQGKCNLFVLTVGVPSNLQYTDEDAIDISDAFATQDNGNAIYGDVKQRMALTGEKCAKSTIKGKLNGLKKSYDNGEILPKDMIVFMISSHGGYDQKGFYAVCKDAEDDSEENHLYANEVIGILNQIPCKKLILIDACHSGAGTKVEPSALNNAIKEMSTNLNGIAFFASSQGYQLSQEDAAWQNGAFTEAILEAFQGKADKNKDGIISLSELESYVVARTFALTNQKQKPIMLKNDLGDKPFFLVK